MIIPKVVTHIVYVFYCPHPCGKKIESEISTADAEMLCRQHVTAAHPDFDPEWHVTYPDGLKD